MTEDLQDKQSSDTTKLLGAQDIPAQLPILPLSDVVVFPHMIAPLLVASPSQIRLIDDVVAGDRLVGVTLQKNPDDEHPRAEQLQQHGCIARVARMLKFPDESVRVLVHGLKRLKIDSIVTEKPYLVARISPIEDEIKAGIELAALARNATNQFQEIVNLSPNLPDELKVTALNLEDPGKLADMIAANLNLSLEEKQGLLATADVRVRLSLLT